MVYNRYILKHKRIDMVVKWGVLAFFEPERDLLVKVFPDKEFRWDSDIGMWVDGWVGYFDVKVLEEIDGHWLSWAKAWDYYNRKIDEYKESIVSVMESYLGDRG